LETHTITISATNAQAQINTAAQAKGLTPKEFEDVVSKLMKEGKVGTNADGSLSTSKNGKLKGDIDNNGTAGDQNDVAAVASAINKAPQTDSSASSEKNPSDVGPKMQAEADKAGVSGKAYADVVVNDLKKSPCRHQWKR
jgi:hypothetical protein